MMNRIYQEANMDGIISIIKGVTISIIFTLICLLIFSLVLAYTNVSESFTAPVIIIVTAISIFVGSSIGNLKMRKNGLLNGALIGGIYLTTLYLISGLISKNFTLTLQSAIMIISGMICGMFGGIIGVNKG
jgi:putative membrane protein, TIGR04086 family